MTQCPSQERFHELLAGSLADADERAIDAHVRDCTECLQTLDCLTTPHAKIGETTRVFVAPIAQQSVLRRWKDLPHSGSSPLVMELESYTPRVPGCEMLGRLGEGGMGVVYKARQIGLNRTVAVKLIRASALSDENQLARFRSEAESAARLQHPNIVQVYEIGGDARGTPYIVLEYVAGGTLARRLHGVPQSARESAELVETLARAADYAHELGVVHRDLKPSNILLAEEFGNRNAEWNDSALSGLRTEFRVPKIADFGLAKRMDGSSDHTRTGEVLGTPNYMSPEQAEGKGGSIGPACDIYALGAILYEMLTGRPPFQAETPVNTLLQVLHHDPVPVRRLQPAVPADLETICLKCLNKSIASRYRTAAELADDLRRYLDGKAILARRTGHIERGWRWCRRNPAIATLVVGLYAVLLLGSSGVLWKWREAEHRRAEANDERRKVLGAQKATHRLLAANMLDKGVALADRGDVAEGLFWMLEGLRLAPEEDFELQRSIRVQMATWQTHANALRRILPKPNTAPLEPPPSEDLLAISPNGRLQVKKLNDGASCQLFDVASNLRIGSPMLHPFGLNGAFFSADGRIVWTAGDDGVVRGWSGTNGRPIGAKFPRYDPHHLDLTATPDGRILTAGDGKDAMEWELARSQTSPFQRMSESAGVTSRGKTEWFQVHGSVNRNREISLASLNDVTAIWDNVTGLPLGAPLLPPSPFGTPQVALSLDGRRAATAHIAPWAEGFALLWDTETGQIVAKLPHINWVKTLAFSPDGTILATGGYDRAVRLWDAETGRSLGPALVQTDIVWGLAISPDNRTIAATHTNSYSGKTGIEIWDRTTASRIRELNGGIERVEFSPDGKRLIAINGYDIFLYDTATWKLAAAPLKEGSAYTCAVFSTDARELLTGSVFGTVRFWDIATGKPHGEPMLHASQVNAVALSPDGRYLVAGCADGSARLWDRATHKPIGPPVQHGRKLLLVGFSPKGDAFTTVCDTGDPRRWTIAEPLEGDVDRIALRLQIRTGLELKDGTVIRLSTETWEERRKLLESLEGSANSAYAGMLGMAAWHDVRAQDAEMDGDSFAALWHLDRMIAERPTELAGYLRRGRLYSDIGQFDKAAADYNRAAVGGSPHTLENWYRHCIARAEFQKSWTLALWYLNRIIEIAPADWRLYDRRANVYGKLGKPAEQKADVYRAISSGADALGLEQFAEAAARREEWGNAAVLFANAAGPRPLLSLRYRLVLSQLKAGDSNGYRASCVALLRDFEKTNDPNFANMAAWSSALAPDALADYAPAIALAERALAGAQDRHGVLNTLGAILVRAGKWDEAKRRLDEAVAANGGKASLEDQVFLAMIAAHFRKPGESRHGFDQLPPAAEDKAFSWEKVERELLRREADAAATKP